MATGVRDIDIALLRAFVAVVSTGSMTAAARVVHLSQGAVSQQIKRLEGLLDAILFDRGGDSLKPTPAGQRLLAHAQRLIALNDEVVRAMRGADEPGEIRLGVAHDVAELMAPTVFQAFRRRHPEVQLTLLSDNNQSMRELLRGGQVDLAVLAEREPGQGEELLLSDDLVWVGARGGEAPRRRPLPVAVCHEERCGVRAATIEALGHAGIPWRPIGHLGHLESVTGTIEADMAVSTFLANSVPDGLDVLRGHGLPALPHYYVNLRRLPGADGAALRTLEGCIRASFARGEA
ncbi:LysR family transcriptional regulator [Lysobacter sp. Root604]|uniref:LysR family transcriptional regulator n=1 Tax=Lysobacter sp. Root604 TaxID=1736568 RepID=UPI0006FE0EF1|nr:LysR family transcriptional regulator [Lysobacter sp. Root604]KRA14991.1 hypothetical protein ASD69_19165 [Lysobacter sp. Root604]